MNVSFSPSSGVGYSTPSFGASVGGSSPGLSLFSNSGFSGGASVGSSPLSSLSSPSSSSGASSAMSAISSIIQAILPLLMSFL